MQLYYYIYVWRFIFIILCLRHFNFLKTTFDVTYICYICNSNFIFYIWRHLNSKKHHIFRLFPLKMKAFKNIDELNANRSNRSHIIKENLYLYIYNSHKMIFLRMNALNSHLNYFISREIKKKLKIILHCLGFFYI